MLKLCSLFPFFICSLFFHLKIEGSPFLLEDISKSSPLPGRVNSSNIYYTQLGGARIFFYMSKEKDTLARQFVNDINEKIMLTVGHTAWPCPVSEIILLNAKSNQPSRYDQDGKAIYIDPVGQVILETYADKVKEIAESLLGVHLQGLSYEVELNTNYDALKIHQDPFTKQYEYLKQLPIPIPRYSLFQDLTSIDWQMARGTFAATMVQDGNEGDRFLMILSPGETVGTIYTEPIIHQDPNESPTYPGPISFPFHSSVAPTDFESSQTVGTWKGKRMSTSIRGVILEEEVEKVVEKSLFLPINRPERKTYAAGLKSVEYPNGVIFRELPYPLIKENSSLVYKLTDQENITILELQPKEHQETTQMLKEIFSIEGSLTHIYRLIKKDSGFSHLDKLHLNISASSTIVIINHSHLPQGYKYFTIAEDCVPYGKPWIHLYEFPPHMAMKIPIEVLRNTSMTTLEELLFRNEVTDAINSESSTLTEKLVTELDIFILN